MDKKYLLVMPDGKSRAYSAEEFASPNIQKWLETTPSDKYSVYEQSPISDNDEELEGDVYNIRLVNGNTAKERRYSSADWHKENVQNWIKEHPEAEVSRIRPYDYWGERAKTQQNELNEFERANGNFMAEYEARQAELTDDSIPQERRTKVNEYVQENARAYDKLKAELDTYRQAYDNNPAVIAERNDYRNQTVDDLKRQMAVNEARWDELGKQDMAAQYDPNDKTARRRLWLNRLALGMNPAAASMAEQPGMMNVTSQLTGNAEAEANYRAANQLLDESVKLYGATKKEDFNNLAWYQKAAKGVTSFGKAAKDRITDKEFWESTLDPVSNDYAIGRLHTKVTDLIGSYKNISEADMVKLLDENLTDSEQALLEAYLRNAQAMEDNPDTHWTYTAGGSFADSMKFMAEFMLGSGATGAATKGATKGMLKWFAKRAGQASTKLGRAAIKGAGKLAVGETRALVGGAIQTAAAPSTYANIASKMSEINDAGQLNSLMESVGDGLFDAYIENASEFGLGLTNKALSAGKKGLAKAIGHTRWGSLYSPAVGRMMERAGIQSGVEEWGEELNGAYIRSLAALISGGKIGDEKEWDNFWSKDNQLVLLASFAPTIGGGAAISEAQRWHLSNQMSKKKGEVLDYLTAHGYDDDSAFAFVNAIGGDTPYDLINNASPYLKTFFQGNHDENAIRLVLDYISTTARALEADSRNAIDQRDNRQHERELVSGSMQNHTEFTMPRYTPNGEAQVESVRRIQMGDKTGYMVGGDEQGWAINYDDGSVGILSEEQIQNDVAAGTAVDTGWMTADDFLDMHAIENKNTAEQMRMESEQRTNLAELQDALRPGSTINIGTTEAPLEGVVSSWTADGAIIEGPEGFREYTWEELARITDRQYQPKTDVELAADEAARLDRFADARAQMDETAAKGYASIQRDGITYNITAALGWQDREDGQQMHVYATDADGNMQELWLNDNEVAQVLAEGDVAMQRDVQQRVTENVQEETPHDIYHDFRGNLLPMTAEGQVDEAALWNNDPEAWARWNDEQKKDNGTDSNEYINAAISKLQQDADALMAQRKTELDFVKRNAIDAQLTDIAGRVSTLRSVLERHNQPAIVSKGNAVTQRIADWQQKLGVKINSYSTLDEIPDERVRKEMQSGRVHTAWYDPKSDSVNFFLPNIADAKMVDSAVLHEVIAHKGLRQLLGSNYDTLLDRVYNELMDDKARQHYSGLVTRTASRKLSEQQTQRMAADEFIAYMAQDMDLSTEESQTLWQRLCEFVKDILDRLNVGGDLTIDDLRELLQASMTSYIQQNGERQQSVLDRIPTTTDKKGSYTYNWEAAPDAATALAGLREAGYEDSLIRQFAKNRSDKLREEKKRLEKRNPATIEELKAVNDLLKENTRVHIFWNDIVALMNNESKEQERRRKDVINTDTTGLPGITERFNAGNRLQGMTTTRTLAGGLNIKGHFELVESGAVTPSHNPETFAPTEGYPTNENGSSINDRDYEHDEAAQQSVRQKAGIYDQRAYQEPVIVSREGVVLSGNDRTMAGMIAADKGTDTQYVESLMQDAPMYGFTDEQVKLYAHPRLVFVLDEDMPYTTETMAMFNQSERKTQNKTEQMVKSGKAVKDTTFAKLADVVSRFDNTTDMYRDQTAAAELMKVLMSDGVLNQQDIEQFMDNGLLSRAGQEYMESLIIGYLFNGRDTTVRRLMADGMGNVRRSIVGSLAALTANRTMGEYSLQDIMEDAIAICYEAHKGFGGNVGDYLRQRNLFESDNTESYLYLAKWFAIYLNSGSLEVRAVLDIYNRSYADSAGIEDVFGGRTAQDAIKEITAYIQNKYNDEIQGRTAENGNTADQRSQLEGSPENRTGNQTGVAGTEQGGPVRDSDAQNGTAVTPLTDREWAAVKLIEVGADARLPELMSDEEIAEFTDEYEYWEQFNDELGQLYVDLDGDLQSTDKAIKTAAQRRIDTQQASVVRRFKPIEDMVRNLMAKYNLSEEEFVEETPENTEDEIVTDKLEQAPKYEEGASEKEIQATKFTQDEWEQFVYGGSYITYKSERTGEYLEPVYIDDAHYPIYGDHRVFVWRWKTSEYKDRVENQATSDYVVKYLKANRFRATETKYVKNQYGFWTNEGHNGCSNPLFVRLPSVKKSQYASSSYIDYYRDDDGLWNISGSAEYEIGGGTLSMSRHLFNTKSDALRAAIVALENFRKEHPGNHYNLKDVDNLIEHLKTKVLPLAMKEDGEIDVVPDTLAVQGELFTFDNRAGKQPKNGKAKTKKETKKPAAKKAAPKKVVQADEGEDETEETNGRKVEPTDTISFPDSENRIYLYEQGGKWESKVEVHADNGNMSGGPANPSNYPYNTREDAIRHALNYAQWYAKNIAGGTGIGHTGIDRFVEQVNLTQIQSAEPTAPAYGSQNTIITADKYEELKRKMREKLNNLNAGFDPEVFFIGAQMAAFHVEAGARKFVDFAKRMIEDLGDAIRPYLKSIYNGARDLPGMEPYRNDMDSAADVDAIDVNAITLDESTSIQPIGAGPFGYIYNQFKGNAQGAIEFLLENKNGEATEALYHKELGYIDLVWGEEGAGKSDGYGLAKIAKYHPEVLNNLQEIIDDMEVVSRSNNRVQLESETHKASVRLTWDNEKKNWLLTAFEKKNSVPDNTTDTDETSNRGKRNDTATPQNTVSEDKDTQSVENSNEIDDNNAVNEGDLVVLKKKPQGFDGALKVVGRNTDGTYNLEYNPTGFLPVTMMNVDADDFIPFVRHHREDISEQRREVEAQQPQESAPAAEQTTGRTVGEIGTYTHTKTGREMSIVRLTGDRLSADEFKELKARAKELGGYYSSYGGAKGFLFDNVENATKFNNLEYETEQTDEQTATDTAAIVSQAASVAEQAQSIAQTEEPADTQRAAETITAIDEQLDKIDSQLALLGYYTADTSDRSKFHESYGYMKSAEEKARKDAEKLARKLAADLGIEVDKKRIAKTNVAPAGGDVTFRLPLKEGRELYVNIEVTHTTVAEYNAYMRGEDYLGGYGDDLAVGVGPMGKNTAIMYRVENTNGVGGFERYGSNNFAPYNVTYQDLLNGIRRVAREFLPEQVETPAAATAQSVDEKAEKPSRTGKSKKKEVNSQSSGDSLMGDLFADIYHVEDEQEENEPAPQDAAVNAPAKEVVTELNGYKIGDRVLYTDYTGKTQEATIYEFDGGRPVLDSGFAPVMYELVEWDNIKPIDNGLEGNDAVRTQGLPADNTRPAEGEGGSAASVPETDRQEAGGADRAGESGGQSGEQPGGSVRRVPRLSGQNKRNNHVSKGEAVYPKTPAARFKANIAAIRLLKQLQTEGKQATKEQMAVLRQFTGWGGLGGYFNNSYSEENRELRSLLTGDEFDAAQLSINTAYYTPTEIIDTLWDVAAKLGFQGGKILEGSAGIGNILASIPKGMNEASQITAVELDNITGGILEQLYPDAQVYIRGFETVDIDNASVDLAITNVPFGENLKIYDAKEKDLTRLFGSKIHDFCIAKNIRKLRPGGIGIFISSRGTLDSSSRKLRQWIVNEGGCDVIGAFRLNNETFVGTGATADIIVVRKRVNNQVSPDAIDVTGTEVVRSEEYETGETEYNRKEHRFEPIIGRATMEMNTYFTQHPEFMGGEMAFGYEKGNSYRAGSAALYPSDKIDQAKRLKKWVSQMKEYEPMEVTPAAMTTTALEDTQGVKEGQLIVNSKGEICQSRRGKAVPVPGINDNKVKGKYTKAQVLADYDALKAAIKETLDYQLKNESDEGLQPLLKKLNRVYDDFVKKYGYLTRNASISFLKNDVEYSATEQVEIYKEKKGMDGKVTADVKKAQLFFVRQLNAPVIPTPETVQDGVIVSMNQFGRINIPFIAQAMKLSEDKVREDILAAGVGFEDPASGEVVIEYEYLSGNVREKLEYANEHNPDGRYDNNIKALQNVIPADIPAHLIEFSLGSDWLPTSLYVGYAHEKFGVNDRFLPIKVGGSWTLKDDSIYYIDGKNEQNRSAGVTSNALNIIVYGHELMLAAMNNKTVEFVKTETVGGEKETRRDKEATAAATTKMNELRDDFKEWARQKMQSDEELAAQVSKIYNELFNSMVPKQIRDIYVPEHFNGMANVLANGKPLSLRPHQARAVIRSTTEPVILAHEVGTGKTFTLITAAMEMRRLGTAKKPMIVVQNATLGQFVASAKELYPSARILTISEQDRTVEGRGAFYAKIRYNDWDLIIVPQSVFEMMPDSEERRRAFIQSKIEEKEYMLSQAEQSGDQNIRRRLQQEIDDLKYEYETGEKPTKGKKKDSKRQAESINNAKVKAQRQLDRRTDDVSNFDEMGIDALLIDEAHAYKHLGFATAMQRGVKGVDASGSKRAAGVFLKTRSIFDRVGWKNVVFATGTPISNTAAEIWTFMKYLLPDDFMWKNHIYYFDDFVRNFGSIQQNLEFTTSGKFKETTRFAAYTNLPELVRVWMTIADVVLTKEAVAGDGETLNDKVPRMEEWTDDKGEKHENQVRDIYLPQSASLITIMAAVRAELERFENMSGKEKQENSHIPLVMFGTAKAAAIDTRLVSADSPDEPQSKTNRAVEETLKALEDSKRYKGTCALFCDTYRRWDYEGGRRVEGFNVFDEIRRKLIARGVPADQIIIMESGMSTAAKEKIFAKVNNGEIRVIMGTTATLGTGVNIQERLFFEAHLDAPNRPMDYTQRMGRILRQGNLHKEWGIPVRVIRFGVEDSLDVTAYQRLSTKSKFINSVMDSKHLLQNGMEDRVLEEEEEGEFDNPVAILSGSEYALLKTQAERELRKLQNKKEQHRQDQIYIENKLKKNNTQLGLAESNQAKYQQALDNTVKAFPDGIVKEIAVEGVKCKDDKAVAAAVKAKIQEPISAIIADLRRLHDEHHEERHTYTMTFDGVKANVIVNLVSTYGYDFNKGEFNTKVSSQLQFVCDECGFTEPVDMPGGYTAAKDIVEYFKLNVANGSRMRHNLELLSEHIDRLKKDNELMLARKGKPFADEDKLKEQTKLVEDLTEKMKVELAAKEAKYAEELKKNPSSFVLHTELADEDINSDDDSTPSYQTVTGNATQILDYYENPDGIYSYMSDEGLVSAVEMSNVLMDDERVRDLVDEYRRLDAIDREEGRRDFTGGEMQDLVEFELVPLLHEIADNENATERGVTSTLEIISSSSNELNKQQVEEDLKRLDELLWDNKYKDNPYKKTIQSISTGFGGNREIITEAAFQSLGFDRFAIQEIGPSAQAFMMDNPWEDIYHIIKWAIDNRGLDAAYLQRLNNSDKHMPSEEWSEYTRRINYNEERLFTRDELREIAGLLPYALKENLFQDLINISRIGAVSDEIVHMTVMNDGANADTFIKEVKNLIAGEKSTYKTRHDAVENALLNSALLTTDDDVLFQTVTDPVTIAKLEAGDKIRVYRAMQEIDGKLYLPMAARVDGKMVEPVEMGKWEQAVERPELADAYGRYKLDKGNGKSLKARYNPYIHTSRSPLNDQFTSAYDRPNLVTVEVEVPESELTSGYKAQNAKDSVGEIDWHSGPVSSKLPKEKSRKVILTRWDKPIRVVPDSEVAQKIAQLLEGEDIAIPYNTVTPSLRYELEQLGVKISGQPSGNVRGAKKVLTDNQVKMLSYVTGMSEDEIRTLNDESAGLSAENGIFASNNRNNERGTDDIQRQAGRAASDDAGRRADAVRRSDDTEAGVPSRQSTDDIVKPLRKLKPGETCLVERKLSEAGDFSFIGRDRIESLEDVAFIFRKLETKAVENSFIVFVKDGKPTVLHVGMGHIDAVNVDLSPLTVMMKEIKPDKVYFVHNHPSGNIISSTNDRKLWAEMQKILGKKLEPGIIIDTTRGVYGTYMNEFDSSMPENFTGREGDVKIPTYRFDEIVFSKDYDPVRGERIRTSRDVAAYVSSHRLGERDKISVLCINRNNIVVGNFFLPYTGLDDVKTINKIAVDCAYYAGITNATAVVVYGSGVDPRTTNQLDAVAGRIIKTFLNANGTILLDMVGGETAYDGGLYNYYSYNDHGRLSEPGMEYGGSADEIRYQTVEPTDYEGSAADLTERCRAVGANLGVPVQVINEPFNGTISFYEGGTLTINIGTLNGRSELSAALLAMTQKMTLSEILGDEAVRSFAQECYRVLPEFRQKVVEIAQQQYGWNTAQAMMQYLGSMAESDTADDEATEAWGAIWNAFENMLDKVLDKAPMGMQFIGQNELRYILFQNAHQGDKSIATIARGAALAHNLGLSAADNENRTDGAQAARVQQAEERTGESAANLYNRVVSRMWSRMDETYRDQFQSVNTLVDALEKASGKKAQGFEDIRKSLNQQSSKGLAAMQKWEREHWDKMMKAVQAIIDERGLSYDEVERYLMLKHGVERNDVFAKRDARAYYQAIHDAKVTSIREFAKQHPDVSDEEIKKRISREDEILDRRFVAIESGTDSKYKELREKDYGGLTGLYSKYENINPYDPTTETQEEYEKRLLAARKPMYDNMTDMELAADAEIADFEKRIGSDLMTELWNQINGATKAVLKHQYDANMMSRSQYEHVRDMFKYYVPLRGFAETTPEDMYSYYTSNADATFVAPLKQAKGRKTRAESPLAYIGAMASSAIAADIKNESKLALYYFVSNRQKDNDLVLVSDVWYVKQVDEEGNALLDEQGRTIFEPQYPPFTEALSTDQAKAEYEQWENEMKQLAREHRAFRGVREIEKQRLNYVVNTTKQQVKSHIIAFKLGGRDMFMFINGNPRAAQAINGELNVDASKNEFTKATLKFLRAFASLNTSLNPEFWLSNLQRDTLFALMSVNVKEDKAYNEAFRKNLKQALKVVRMKRDLQQGKLGNSELEQHYRMFVENGGVTGYTSVRGTDVWEAEIKKYTGETRTAIERAGTALDVVQEFGESFEQLTRFAAYLTSREQGRSVVESVADAKELTVNFNRKGSGKGITWKESEFLRTKEGRKLNDMERLFAVSASMMSVYGRHAIMFFNASVQGLNAMYLLAKKDKSKLGLWVGGYLMLGAMNAVLHAMLDGDGDDDDQYLDVPDYERRNNLLLGLKGVYLKWALPQEARVFYGMGDMIVNHSLGREPHRNIVGEVASMIGEIAPLDATSGLAAVMPSITTPVVEVIQNEDYKGARVYNDNRFLSDEEKKHIPAYRNPLKNTSKVYLALSEALNWISGGNEYEAGAVNWNPNIMEHIVEGYTGGVGTTVGKGLKFMENALGGEVKISDTPFLRRLMTWNDDRYRNAHVTDLYYYYREVAQNTERLIKEAAKAGDEKQYKKVTGSYDYKVLEVWKRYEREMDAYDKYLRLIDTKDRKQRKQITREHDALRSRMIKEISDLK